MTTQEAIYKYALRLGDNSLILGHRLSELCSRGPILEEDLALTNISLDMIGRTQALLKYAAEIEGKGKTEDDLAYRRPENNYYNNLITEQPNGDFAHTITRQLFISVFEYLFYSQLEKSKDETLSAIAKKTVKEIKYHMQHATDWTIRLGDGTEESHKRMQKAVNDLWMYTGELFEMDEVDTLLFREGISADLIPIKAQWQNDIKIILIEATLTLPEDSFMQTGSKQGIHTENLGHILAEMQYLQRAYPDAKW
ncbi:MAG: 1,2-phenylacetyl-CoA epoxidase subunit PaaC [Bacteroidota bacterium]|nr:1,2-phenylacetyl-CoA epoxidase subunit PaaC [Bacteroidota bacterium]MDP3145819.1 1,2-phenylacetyl-CoA epoxidase subunit PaaC [Bacteroidota bacterium]